MSTFPDQFRLDGRTAPITGSGRGLGWEMARALAEAGARVGAAWPIRPIGWRHWSRELRDAGFAADLVVFDLADRTAMRQAPAGSGR